MRIVESCRSASRSAPSVLAVLALVVSASAAGEDPKEKTSKEVAPAESISIADCDLSVLGVAPSEEDATKSAEEIEEDALTEKLAQFDECLDRIAASTSGKGGGSAGGSGKEKGSAGGTDSRTGKKSGAETEPTGLDPPEATAADDPPTQTQTESDVVSKEKDVSGETLPHEIATAERIRAEDNVAQVLREAAEAETDPDLRKELWDQYDNYMKSIGK